MTRLVKDVRDLIRHWQVQAVTLLSVCCVLGVPAESPAQTNSEINTGLQFDFPLPGARSLGMGGAFVAVADDATAAVANPAGLTALVRPEVSLEARGWRFVSISPLRGHAFGSPTNIGVDNVASLIYGETPSNAVGASFLSAVVPKGRFVVGFYRHEQARYRADVLSEGPFITNQGGSDDRLPPFTGTMELKIANYGASMAYRFANGLSVGGGLAFSDFSIDSRVRILFYLPDRISAIVPASNRVNFTGRGQTFGPANFDASNTISTIVETGEDHGAAFNIGALYRAPGSKWSAGGAVRRNPEFTYRSTSTWGPAHPFAPARGTLVAPAIDDVAFKVPDVYSIGGAFHASDQFLVTAQYDRVQFSQLTRNFRDVNGENEGEGHLAAVTGLKAPDSNQTRFGMEYALVRGTRVTSFRVGTGYESAHHITYKQTTPNVITRFQVLYPETEGQWHITPGGGVAFRKFQIDAAVDLSSRTKTVSASTVFRF